MSENTVLDGVLEIVCWSDPARKVHVQDQEAILPVRCCLMSKKRE